MSDEIINNLFPTKEELEEQGIVDEVQDEIDELEEKAQRDAKGREE